MHIVALKADNIKRIQAVEIRPKGALVEITGRNRQGKSSTIDAIWFALGGKREIAAIPIRRGETEASIHLDLGSLRVTRTFHLQDDGDYTSYLRVENADGAAFSKPQDMLDAIVGELASDPVEFLDLPLDKQVAILKRFVPGFDFAADEASYKADFTKRTEVNRQAKDLRAQAAAIALPSDVPAVAVDTTEIVEALRSAGAKNQALEAERATREREQREIDRLETEAAQKFAAAEEARRRARMLEDEATQLTEAAAARRANQSALPPIAEPVDTAALTEQLQAAQRANDAFAVAERRKNLEVEAAAKEQQSRDLTKALEERETARAKVIANSEMPVPGLAFAADGVTLNGLPFEQASGAEQLRASLAIAAALNPKLRVILVRDGSRLDSEAMQLLDDYAAEKDLQVWIETIESSRPGAIIIEDGRVATPQLMAAE